ncbi:raffinose/stachyose/melibiose transport system substrate-binding protein [Streptohalobacillus salinus]|uniref:Raffinose/stachyose/melibiose transport system substrate-binding protein n=1 Tax=Streptohalobacillus salinus TaxID=621096 RepID=A0A2V3WAI6_9BACI|nr:ABC transporter substrate-binding protein [Streptohalobacillus salinus]PXW91080.1 raffinose/stachyose/melibiose transport system substrate-binding protein [Streptohalobacillus salinus]
MKKKMMLWVVGMLTFLLVLAGCASDAVNEGSSGNDTNDSGGSSEEDTALTNVDIFQFKVEFKDQFEELVQLYMEENDDVNLSVQTVGGGNDYAASLKAQMASGNEPVIFNIGGPTELEEYRDYLTDLSDTEAASLALDGTLNGVEEDGAVYGLPFAQEGYGLIYNKNIFDEVGIDPATLTTFEAMEDAFKTIDEQKEALGLEAVVALPASELWVMGNHLANNYIAPEFNNDILTAYEADSISFEYGDQMKRMLDLQNDYSVQPVLSLDYSMQVEQLFSTGKVAVIQQGNWIYPTVEQMDSDFATNGIGMMPMPFEGEYEDHLPVGVPQYWVVNQNASEEEIQAAKDFLDWMYTSDQGKDFVLDEFKFIPAYDGYDASRISDPLSQDVYKYSVAGKTLGWTFMATPVGWNEDILATEFQKYLAGDVTFEEALDVAKQSWESSRQ